MRATMYLAIATFIFSYAAFAQIDNDVRGDYRKECLQIADFIKKDYNVQCENNYNHFNSSAYRKLYDRDASVRAGKARIAGFNVLHPGMSKTRYKDYRKVAQIINEFDVVGVTELLPLVSDDLRNNEDVVKFIRETPAEIDRLRQRIKKESAPRRKKEYIAELESLQEDLLNARQVYRMPGYLRILHALHELKDGKEWALLLSPRGEAARETDVQELVGYYYRASRVKPKFNEYCKDIRSAGRAWPVACIPNMGSRMLGQNKKDMFSRRPFLAEFISGRFSFALLTTHVVYTSPREEDKMRYILRRSFGVDHYQELGVGANAANYARFAEVKVILDFMEQLRERYAQKDVILVGDLNLEFGNQFWDKVLPSMPGAKLFVNERTTISERRYDSDGAETNGVSSDYDHFIFDPRETNECASESGQVDAKAFDFYTGAVAGYLNRSFKVRKEKKYRDKYEVDRDKYRQVERLYIRPFRDGPDAYRTIGSKTLQVGSNTIRVKGIIHDDDKNDKYIEGFYERVLDSQLSDESYYRYFSELISDHKPIYMSCSTR